MHISKLSVVNYRNFSNAKFVFNKAINTIIGENGSGKTNVFRAIRLLLDDKLLRYSYKLNESDFNRSLGEWRGHWIIISLEFSELTQDEEIQALFMHGVGNHEGEALDRASYNLIFRPVAEKRIELSNLKADDKDGLLNILEEITIDDYETVFTGKSSADFNDAEVYKILVGDFEKVVFPEILDDPLLGLKVPKQLSVAREVSFTFIKALRDVVADFQNNRTNPLLKLLKSKSEEIDPVAFDDIVEQVKELNEAIETLDDVEEVRDDIQKTIKETVGETYSPNSLSIKSGLSDEAEKIFQSLKLYIGESEDGYEGGIHELSLGGANLIYLTLKLLEFKYLKAKQPIANFLLIEEPEAHIHTHIQKSLFDKINFGDTQIIYSTHSTHISEVSNIENINVLVRDKNVCSSYQPSNGLSDKAIRNIQRYLDAIRSNLLFAKSVILVEGDTEEILMPILVKKVLGISLDELGISLINIRSVGFENISMLFHGDRIHKKCSIITDLDASIIDTELDDSDSASLARKKRSYRESEKRGLSRQEKLDEFSRDNKWLDVFYADYTFEVDFVMSDNSREVIDIVGDVYVDDNIKTRSVKELESVDVAVYGARVLQMANYVGKGWFAVILGNAIKYDTFIPIYILNAIFESAPPIKKEIWLDVFTYRINCAEKEGGVVDSDIKDHIKLYRNGDISFDILTRYLIDNSDDEQLKIILDEL